MTFNPQQELVNQLAQILSDSLSSNSSQRASASTLLEQARTQPEFDNYLLYLLIFGNQSTNVQTRAAAGLMLKNDIRFHYKILPDSVTSYIKQEVLKGLSDPEDFIRSITGNVITTMVSSAGILGWPDILSKLMVMIEIDNQNVQEAAISALAKICEDNGPALNTDYGGERPYDFMIPKLVSFSAYPYPKVRSQALFCLNQVLTIHSESIYPYLDDYLTNLFKLATDPDSETRKNVCIAFALILEARPDKLYPNLQGVVNYAVHSLDDQNDQVAVEACEILLSLAESLYSQDDVEKLLKVMLPAILRKMVYSDVHLFILSSIDENDANIADKDEDIKPVLPKTKEARTTGSNHPHKDHDHNADDDDDDDDDGADDELGLGDWNLRKCAAAALDMFANRYPESVIHCILPYLRENLVSNDWPVRESAILAFGAVAEGCTEYITPYLGELIPFLVNTLKANQAAVRQISSWTISRYSLWIAQDASNEGPDKLFVPVMQGILQCCLDNNKKVQESSCSAFATLTESNYFYMIPYISDILHVFSLCFERYQNKNLVILYDAVQTFVDHVGYELKRDEYVTALMTPLMTKWNALKDDSHNWFPLLESMSSIASMLGEKFLPYAPTVYEQAFKFLHDTLVQDQNYQQDSSVDQPDKDFVVTSLDLIDGVVQGLGPSSRDLVKSNQPPLMEMLIVTLKDPIHEVRQSGFALLGDLSIHLFDIVEPYVSQIMPLLIPQMILTVDDTEAVCNNATWSAGEIALKIGNGIDPYLNNLLQKLFVLFTSELTVTTVLENASITIGRLGLSNPDIIAPHLKTFARPWCRSMMYISSSSEKESAFKGMCTIVASNPEGLQNDLIEFVETIGRYDNPSSELSGIFSKILVGYKEFVPNWDKVVMDRLPDVVAEAVREKYHV